VGPGWLPFILAVAGGIGCALLAHLLEPVRRVLIGIQVGALLGFAVAGALGLGPVLAIVVALVGAAVGGLLIRTVFDQVIVIASAISGAALVMDGASLIFPGLTILNRGAIVSNGRWVALLIWVALAAAGVAWQFASFGWRDWARRAAGAGSGSERD
jgi:hypothetical protein